MIRVALADHTTNEKGHRMTTTTDIHCPTCGLPMSYAERQDDDEPVALPETYWYCDGPNDNTNDTGCGECVPA